jgi:hypothetical protein
VFYLVRHIYVLRFIRIHCALHLIFIQKTDAKILILIPNILYSSIVHAGPKFRDINNTIEM